MKKNYLILLLTTIFMVGCTDVEDAPVTEGETASQEVAVEESEKEETIATVADEPVVEETPIQPNNDLFSGYKLIEVDGGDLSGHRESKVVVDIGYGDR